MSISAIGNSINLSELYGISSATSTTSSSSTTATASTSSSADSIEFSDPSQLFSKLQQLQESDPEKFKEICTKIADQLKNAATESTDERESNMMSDLASKFEDVASGGDISQLKPPPPPPGGFGGPSGVEAYAQQSESASGVNSSSSSGTSMKDLLASLLSEVDEALTD